MSRNTQTTAATSALSSGVYTIEATVAGTTVTLLQNLLQNAVTHSPAGGLISIGALPSPRGVELVISDRGPGADPASLPRLLRPFEQGSDALTRVNDGVGLGLPISALLMRAMHGQLRLKSKHGEGFTAIVTLPPAP